ncbi:MAG: twin-arginine translocation signal domain-containing protein, partial [Methylococcales bacterium]
MERRDFMRLSTVGLVAGVVTPGMALATTYKPFKGTSDIYYTKEDAGRWSGKVATHLPNIEIQKVANVLTVKVVTAHEMKGY